MKTPKGWHCDGACYLNPQTYSADAETHLASVGHAPSNHYARKNLGYLFAMAHGASLIYDTDDDNIPNAEWKMRDKTGVFRSVQKRGWCNVYTYFIRCYMPHIWPRGFPIDRVWEHTHKLPPKLSFERAGSSPIQQGMVDGDPDVDALWRLLMPSKLGFGAAEAIPMSVGLGRGAWCPFNSQTTWWWPEAYPLLYLPVTAPVRMTDIWRSFVAQRCLWELGKKVVFHSPAEVVQVRNKHNLLHDLASEVGGYLHNSRIAEILGRLKLEPGVDKIVFNLVDCYAALAREGIIDKDEVRSVLAWVDDVRKIKKVWKH